MKFREYLDEGKKSIMSASEKRKINKELHKLTVNKYFDKIPVKQMFDILEKNGFIAIMEDQTPWNAMLTGGVKKTERVDVEIARKNDVIEPSNTPSMVRYNPIDNALLTFTYYKLESGRWEIVAYVG